MLTTISLGTRISVQGELVARLQNGDVVVRDGKVQYVGRPVQACPSGQRPEPAGCAA